MLQREKLQTYEKFLKIVLMSRGEFILFIPTADQKAEANFNYLLALKSHRNYN